VKPRARGGGVTGLRRDTRSVEVSLTLNQRAALQQVRGPEVDGWARAYGFFARGRKFSITQTSPR
jgi:hypothetical protein